jgi:hypothetical protein
MNDWLYNLNIKTVPFHKLYDVFAHRRGFEEAYGNNKSSAAK